MPSQITSDEIRAFAYKNYINPARASGRATVTIRAGDVHSKMYLKDRMPQVCGALGARIFETEYSVTRISEAGPHNGANKTFTFQV
jgi:5-methylcytosine-specific restriction enzyme B